MKLPTLDFFDEIEKKISSSTFSLFDTNMFIPLIFYGKVENGKYKTLSDHMLESGLSLEEIKKTKKDIKEFQKNYFEKVETILKRYNKLTTIERSIEELNNCKTHYLEEARYKESCRFNKFAPPFRKNGRAYTRALQKHKANGIERILDILGTRHFKDTCLENKSLYDSIFSSIEEKTNELKYSTNYLYTDQHLLTTAFYLSAISGQRVDVFSADCHIKGLSRASYNLVNDGLSDMKKRDEHVNHTKVYVHKPCFVGNEFKIDTLPRE